MYDDIAEFRGFYQTSLGRRVSNLIRRQLCAFWRGGPSLSSACLGYGFPFVDKTLTLLAFMPARRGAIIWPSASSVRGCLTEPDVLPLPDVHLDRLLLVHALEFEHDPGRVLDECWRVLDGAGQLMVVVPNRRGLWARAERSPFGHGRPFSGRQLRQLLKSHGFEPRRTRCAVFIPPLAGKFFQRFAPAIERIGAKLWPALGGVLLVEADKILYAASRKGRKLSQRKISDTSVLIGQTREVLSPKILSRIQQQMADGPSKRCQL
jgi:SAM-dependent methyltransferase